MLLFEVTSPALALGNIKIISITGNIGPLGGTLGMTRRHQCNP